MEDFLENRGVNGENAAWTSKSVRSTSRIMFPSSNQVSSPRAGAELSIFEK